MRPVEFTTEQIIEAGQALLDAGRNVTGFALRQRVGGGNPTRLKQVWDEHVASQSVTQAEPVAELPVEVAEEVKAVTATLTERITQLATELNDKAVKAAERRVAEVVRAAGEQRAQADRELADAAQTVEDLETALDSSREESRSLQERLAEVMTLNQTQAVELAQLRERLSAAVDSAKVQLAEAEDAKAAKVAAESALAATKIDLARVQQHATDLESALKEQKQRSVEVIGKLEDSKRHVEAELSEVRKEAREASKALAHATGEADALRAQVVSQEATIRAFNGRK